MRVLVANIPLPTNRFLRDLNSAISDHAKIVQSSDQFWQMDGEFDVVHLHFPEYLTFQLQDAYIHGLKDDLIEDVARRLRYWAERSRIVVTRHVLLPHDAVHDPLWERMYETVYSFADGVVHFADASEAEFRKRYAGTVFVRGAPPIHKIIPHQNYQSLPNTIGRDEARKKLRIKSDAQVMLVFGAIRSLAERRLIWETFHGVRDRSKVLLVSKWMEVLTEVSWIRLKYWIRDFKRSYYRIGSRYRFNYDFVEEDATQLYLNAADVLFIPRFKVLNSGNVTLGMTFGRVVVGPDSWDVGQLLRETGNPVFDPEHPSTAIGAVEEGFRLAKEGQVPMENRRLALAQWTPEQCGATYIEFFREVLERDFASANA